MLNKTHLPFGASIALPLIFIDTKLGSTLNHEMFFIASCFGSFLPDIDVKNSWASQLSPIPFYKFLTHRNQTHYPSFILIFFIIGFILRNHINELSFITGFGIGFLSHLLADWIYDKTRNDDYYCLFEKPLFYLSWSIIVIFFIMIYTLK